MKICVVFLVQVFGICVSVTWLLCYPVVKLWAEDLYCRLFFIAARVSEFCNRKICAWEYIITNWTFVTYLRTWFSLRFLLLSRSIQVGTRQCGISLLLRSWSGIRYWELNIWETLSSCELCFLGNVVLEYFYDK